MRCRNDSHDENNQTVSGERKPPPRRLTSTKTDPGFEARSPDLDPEICRIAPRMLWVHYLTLHYLTLHYLDLPRQQWSLLNRFRTEQGHCGACRKKWRLTDTDLCPCGESCPLTKLNGGLSRLHSADEDGVSWLTNYGK